MLKSCPKRGMEEVGCGGDTTRKRKGVTTKGTSVRQTGRENHPVLLVARQRKFAGGFGTSASIGGGRRWGKRLNGLQSTQ